jgi:hypothetical protein
LKSVAVSVTWRVSQPDQAHHQPSSTLKVLHWHLVGQIVITVASLTISSKYSTAGQQQHTAAMASSIDKAIAKLDQILLAATGTAPAAPAAAPAKLLPASNSTSELP